MTGEIIFDKDGYEHLEVPDAHGRMACQNFTGHIEAAEYCGGLQYKGNKAIENWCPDECKKSEKCFSGVDVYNRDIGAARGVALASCTL